MNVCCVVMAVSASSIHQEHSRETRKKGRLEILCTLRQKSMSLQLGSGPKITIPPFWTNSSGHEDQCSAGEDLDFDRHAIYTIKFMWMLQSPNILAPYLPTIPRKSIPCMMEASSRTSSRRIVGPGPSRSCKPFSRRNEHSHLYHKDP